MIIIKWAIFYNYILILLVSHIINHKKTAVPRLSAAVFGLIICFE